MRDNEKNQKKKGDDVVKEKEINLLNFVDYHELEFD